MGQYQRNSYFIIPSSLFVIQKLGIFGRHRSKNPIPQFCGYAERLLRIFVVMQRVVAVLFFQIGGYRRGVREIMDAGVEQITGYKSGHKDVSVITQ